MGDHQVLKAALTLHVHRPCIRGQEWKCWSRFQSVISNLETYHWGLACFDILHLCMCTQFDLIWFYSTTVLHYKVPEDRIKTSRVIRSASCDSSTPSRHGSWRLPDCAHAIVLSTSTSSKSRSVQHSTSQAHCKERANASRILSSSGKQPSWNIRLKCWHNCKVFLAATASQKKRMHPASCACP